MVYKKIKKLMTENVYLQTSTTKYEVNIQIF